MPDLTRPLTTFNFDVLIDLPGSEAFVDASFSECDGIEMSIETKTIREGGNNTRQIHLVGPMSYGQLTLKRGVTSDLSLWVEWFDEVHNDLSRRATVTIEVLSSDGTHVTTRYKLTGCLPTKIRAPGLSAKDGAVAIEEMQLAYETLERESTSLLDQAVGAVGELSGAAGQLAGAARGLLR